MFIRQLWSSSGGVTPPSSPSSRAEAARIDQKHCMATGAIAWSRAVVWVQPLGPPKISRT